MRNTLPALTYVQTGLVSLAGHVGVGVEGSNATVQGDDKWHTNTVNNLSLPPMDPYGPITRYFEVFSRGTNSCYWEATPSAPWLRLSANNGSVGPNGTDTRVWVSIDWAKAPQGPNTTTANINITTPCRSFDKYGFSAPKVLVPVVSRLVPSNFTNGFVESDGHVSIEGPHFSAIIPPSNSTTNSTSQLTYHVFSNYGRTMGGVGLYPPDTEKLSLGEAPALEYSMYLFTNATAANVTLHISPSHNYLTDNNPLEYAIALYPAGTIPPIPTFVRPVGATVGQQMPPGWGYAVGDAVWGVTGNYTTSRFNVSQEGAYTLRVWCLLPSIVIQKVIVDLGGVRQSYLGPPESFLLGRDKLGEYNQTSFENNPGVLGGVGNGYSTRVTKNDTDGGYRKPGWWAIGVSLWLAVWMLL